MKAQPIVIMPREFPPLKHSAPLQKSDAFLMYADERQLRTPHRLEFRSLLGEMPNFREYSRLN